MFKHRKIIWQLFGSYLFILLFCLSGTILYTALFLTVSPRVYLHIIEGGLCVMAVAAFIAYFVTKKITLPLEQLQENVLNISKGRLIYQMPNAESYEISMLINAVNDMVAQLDDRIKHIEKERNEKDAILSNMVEGVISIDLDEKIISINKAASRFLAQEPLRVVGHSIQEVIRNSDMQAFISRVLNNDPSSKEGIQVKDRFNRTLHVYGSTLTNIKGHSVGALIVLYDITQIKNLETVRRDFVANVSHELKTPITLIKGFIETLQDSAVSEDERNKFLAIVRTHADRLDTIIEDLLMLSRLEQNTESFEGLFEPVSISDAVQKAVGFCADKAKEKSIHLDLKDVGELTVQGSAHLIEQAILNLVDNAVKYSNPNTDVRLSTFQSEEGAGLSVQDSGMGIDPEHLPRLCERFYRIDKARSRTQGGTGLGLAIVKHIMQVHRGKISIESTLGKGSTFRLIFPRRQDDV